MGMRLWKLGIGIQERVSEKMQVEPLAGRLEPGACLSQVTQLQRDCGHSSSLLMSGGSWRVALFTGCPRAAISSEYYSLRILQK